MDLNAIPRNAGLDAEHWAKIIREQGVCFYDSTEGDKPWFTKPTNIKIKDINDKI